MASHCVCLERNNLKNQSQNSKCTYLLLSSSSVAMKTWCLKPPFYLIPPSSYLELLGNHINVWAGLLRGCGRSGDLQIMADLKFLLLSFCSLSLTARGAPVPTAQPKGFGTAKHALIIGCDGFGEPCIAFTQSMNEPCVQIQGLGFYIKLVPYFRMYI